MERDMNDPLRILILGGTDFTLAVAEHLWQAGYVPAGVVYVPEQFDVSYSSSGVTNVRHANLAHWCSDRKIPSMAYESMSEVSRFAEQQNANFALAVGWYHMIPKRIRQLFPKGCAGIHASLLPELRGGAPLNWAILIGKKETGVTLFELSDGIDDGSVYAQRSFPIGERAEIGDLIQSSKKATLDILDDVLPRIADDSFVPTAQSGRPSYCLQRTPEDGRIDWRQPAAQIDCLIRAATHPYPGAYTYLDQQPIYIWRSRPLGDDLTVHGTPGQIARVPEFTDPIIVCGQGSLLIEAATGHAATDLMPDLRKAANRRFS